jgi:hypothetical protein
MEEAGHRVLDVLESFLGSGIGARGRADPGLIRIKNPTVFGLRVRPEIWSRFDGPWAAEHEYTFPDTGLKILEPWDLSGRIAHVNDNRTSNSNVEDIVTHLDTAYHPIGMHVYDKDESLTASFPPNLQESLRRLFLGKAGAGFPYTGNILFYKKGAPKEDFPFRRTYVLLRGFDRFLAKLVLNYGVAIQKTLGATAADLEYSAMSIVQYPVGAGIRQHIDNITDPGGTAGPIASIALGEGEKYLDLFPTITDDRRLLPVRIVTGSGHVVILDGDTRLEYSHCVPKGHHGLMYSLVFKFRRIRTTPGARVNSQLHEGIHYTIDPTTGSLPSGP